MINGSVPKAMESWSILVRSKNNNDRKEIYNRKWADHRSIILLLFLPNMKWYLIIDWSWLVHSFSWSISKPRHWSIAKVDWLIMVRSWFSFGSILSQSNVDQSTYVIQIAWCITFYYLKCINCCWYWILRVSWVFWKILAKI